MLIPTRQSAVILAASSAAFALLFGFVAMTLLWTMRTQDPDLPGHWDYLSGTLGDAIFLPLLTASLVFLALSLSSVHGEAVWATAGALLGAAGGAFVQYSWLADRDPRLNWVLPTPGNFSLPGWYHAVFLVIMSGFLGGTFLLLVTRLRAARAQDLPSGWIVATLTFSVTAFLGLVVLDSTPSASTSSSTATILTCCSALAAGLLPLVIANRSLVSRLTGPLLAGGLAGTVLILVISAT